MKQINTLTMAVGLAAITALAPLATDMYLPALPLIARDLTTDAGMVSSSVMTFFIGFTVGQLFYGPISDRIGRKPVVYFALALFIVGSLGTMTAQSITSMLVWRFIQGLGGSVGMVTATAMVRDLYTGETAAKLLAIIMMITGLAPIIAPMIGSLILLVASWRAMFAFFAIFGLASFAYIRLFVPETRMEQLRLSSHPSHAIIYYFGLMKSRSFIPFAGTLALAQGGFFAYIGGSSAVFIDLKGLSPQMFSLAFGMNAIGMAIGAQGGARLIGRFGAHRIAKTAACLYALALAALLVIELTIGADLWMMLVLFFIAMTAMGAILTNCNMLAMEAHGQIAGVAAALIGALGFGLGALGSGLVSAFDNGTAVPLLAIMAAFALLSALVAVTGFPRPGTTTTAHHH
ncbi:multidrug effflux MFS transporter [Martelella alba]|uniref:Bcr/CflA family efflux transporter n=1 Tax=Martelella alba TaxID=2590451 RepID=A0A506UFC8_9HYPH|nr:multidrug effflux MFS transporter [Martelella alba]TPW30517.1 multidrug effflux MFS transporter [Martelella alba]